MSAEHADGLMQGLHLRVLWSDEDLMEVRARAGNGRFTGSADFYTALDELQSLAEALRGFPAAIPDERSVRLGHWDENSSVGGLELTLTCIRMNGEATARIRMRQYSGGKVDGDESASFLAKVEPAAVDRFVAMLASCGPRAGAEAHLALDGSA